MGIFDVFTGKPAKDAAAQQRAFLGNTMAGNAGVVDQGLNTSLANLSGGYNTGANAVSAGYTDALGALNGGHDWLAAAGGAYDPVAALGGKYGGATTLALNAMGVNGQPAQADARSAFTAGPAHNWNLEQGLEAINRRRAAGGMLDSGNADRDAQTFGAGLASNEYDKWMTNLLGFTNPELAATSGAATGRAAALTGQAGLSDKEANLSTLHGSMLSDLAKWYTGGQASLNTGAANTKVGNSTVLAQPYAQTYKNEADASMAGSANLWNLGMNAAKLGASFAGGLGGMSAPGSGTNASMFGNPNIPSAGFGQTGQPWGAVPAWG